MDTLTIVIVVLVILFVLGLLRARPVPVLT